jgi:YHS domain-containing protein
MKKLPTTMALLAVLGGVLALNQVKAAEPAAETAMPSCCGAMETTAATVDTSKAKPDLLKTCPVSGEKLGEMGKPLKFVYKEQEVKLCCKSCKKDFDKDPEKYMKLIRAADKTDKK